MHLWYRIAVFPILLPRLSERTEDIPALARHFAERAANRFGLAYVEPSEADVQLLISYPWPGNIRELGAVIDRAAILGDGKTLEVVKSLGAGVATIPPPLRPPQTSATASSLRPAINGDVAPLSTTMREHIERALTATRGRIEGPRGAAALLKINPHTLRARMRKLGVDWGRFRSTVNGGPVS